MKLLMAFLCSALAGVASANDLLPEASGVVSSVVTAQSCTGYSDCKTDLDSMTKKLEAKGFIILKTEQCTSKFNGWNNCPSEQKPTEIGRIYFIK